MHGRRPGDVRETSVSAWPARRPSKRISRSAIHCWRTGSLNRFMATPTPDAALAEIRVDGPAIKPIVPGTRKDRRCQELHESGGVFHRHILIQPHIGCCSSIQHRLYVWGSNSRASMIHPQNVITAMPSTLRLNHAVERSSCIASGP